MCVCVFTHVFEWLVASLRALAKNTTELQASKGRTPETLNLQGKILSLTWTP